ncbi:MAG: bifunctional oligoribonuclease/PAP phosphatase NrnA [Smithellaceae bacterium]|nr:bifunctional oligoribonuclease/PAP phosphatase NrnA [Smithellaceae bacterium]
MLQRISELIRDNSRFIITSHVRLDGDAVGSELALSLMLRELGKQTVVYNQDKIPENYLFLPGATEIVHELPPLDGYEVVFILDCSELERVGDEAQALGRVKNIINIDHHISNKGDWRVALVDPQASSTGEMLIRLARHMGMAISKDAATNLYAAILTDTGGFRYRSTSSETLYAAGKLVEEGADPQWISEHIYESNSPAKIRLMSKVLETLSFDLEGKVGSLQVMLQDVESVGALPEHAEGFVDLPRTIKGVVVAVIYTELQDGFIKVSLRSKGDFNVERIASSFGGGGHLNAAACRIRGDVTAVKKLVIDAIRAGFES